ncbi:hypothetical protein D9M71_558660 [compost metagenome]
MHALAATGLEKRLQAQLVEQRQGQLGGFEHGFPRQRRVRVEVEDETVGLVEVLGRGIPGVQFEGVHLHRAEQGGSLVNDHQRLAGFGLVVAFQARDVQLRGVLLEKQLTGQAIRRTHQGHGPALEVRQDPRRNQGVILGHLALADAAAGVDDSFGVGKVQGRGVHRVFHGLLQTDGSSRLVIAQAMKH